MRTGQPGRELVDAPVSGVDPHLVQCDRFACITSGDTPIRRDESVRDSGQCPAGRGRPGLKPNAQICCEQGGLTAVDETRLEDASTEQWQQLDRLWDSLPTGQRLVVLNAVADSRRDGLEPTLEEIEALADMVSGRHTDGAP